MAAGKKGKKTKGKVLSLKEFLQVTTGSPLPVQTVRKSTIDWTDEVEDCDGYDSCKTINVVLPTALRASLDYEGISDKIPNDPPYIAHLSKLPYDVNVEEIASLFKHLKITNMTIPKDDRDVAKLKGFGYVEFEDRESLLKALVIPDTTLNNRRIRIEVSSENDRGRSRMNMGRERGDRSESSFNNWRSGPRSETSDGDRTSGFNRDRDGGGSGAFNRVNAGGGEREEIMFSRDNMRSGDRDNMRDRDSGFIRDRDNKEGYSRGNRNGLDDRSGSWRDDGRSNRNQGRGFGGRRFDNDRDRNGDFTRGRSDRDSEPASSEPRERPKLMLQPRAKPVENVPEKAEAVPSVSVFGGAKPVDTSRREKEIEEKIVKEQTDKPREGSKDRKTTYTSSEEIGRNIERSRPSRKIGDNTKRS